MFRVEIYLTSGQRAKEGTLTHPPGRLSRDSSKHKVNTRYPGNMFLYPNNKYHWSSTIVLGLYWMYLYRSLWRIPAVFGEILLRTSAIGVFSSMADAGRERSRSMRLGVGRSSRGPQLHCESEGLARCAAGSLQLDYCQWRRATEG